MLKNKVQCPNGHYYNADRFTRCPICFSDIGANASANRAAGSTRSPRSTGAPKPTGTPGFSGSPGLAGTPRPTGVPRVSDSSSKTVPLFGAQNEQGLSSIPPTGVAPKADAAGAGEAATGVAPPGSSPPPALQATIDAVTSYKDTEDLKTVAMWNAPAGSEPVVGWLVCLKGEYYGRSFNLKTGNNTVGRAMNMDLHLTKEASVSRNRHCLISFEPESQTFYIQQGESSGLTYLNGAVVMAPVKMAAMDRIKIGQAEFLLFPLCTGGFRWEDYLM